MPHLLPQISLKWAKTKRGYSRNLLIFKALQDGLAPWALKLLEIFRNCKKLNIN